MQISHCRTALGGDVANCNGNVVTRVANLSTVNITHSLVLSSGWDIDSSSVYFVCLSVVLVAFDLVETSRMATLLGKS